VAANKKAFEHHGSNQIFLRAGWYLFSKGRPLRSQKRIEAAKAV
jgi:hypothetical protein